MRFKTLRGSPERKVQRAQYLPAVGLGCYTKRGCLALLVQILSISGGTPKIEERTHASGVLLCSEKEKKVGKKWGSFVQLALEKGRKQKTRIGSNKTKVA